MGHAFFGASEKPDLKTPLALSRVVTCHLCQSVDVGAQVEPITITDNHCHHSRLCEASYQC